MTYVISLPGDMVMKIIVSLDGKAVFANTAGAIIPNRPRLHAQIIKYSRDERFRVSLSKSAKEYSVHSASLDGDEFSIVGASPTINSAYKVH